MNEGYERTYLWIKNKGQVIGFAAFNFDFTVSNEFRCFVRALNIYDSARLQEAVELVLTHIWKNVYCNNIRIELFYQKEAETGKFNAVPEVKTAFQKNGFKWKTLNNDPVTGKRAQVMQANRFATTPAFENPRMLTAGQEPLTFKSGFISAVAADQTQLSFPVSQLIDI